MASTCPSVEDFGGICQHMNHSNVVTWFAYCTFASRPEAAAVRSGERNYQQPRSTLFMSRLLGRQTLADTLDVSLIPKL